MQKISAILFDFDGTLVSSIDLIVQIFNECLLEQGVEARDYDSVRRMIGEPLSVIFQKLTGLVDVEQFNKSFREKEIGRHTAEHILLVHDVEPTLKYLRAQEIRLGIVTTKNREPVRSLLAEHGLENFFECIVGREDVAELKPHPEPVFKACELLNVAPKNVLFVGDSLLDLSAAKEAGAIFVGVLTGASDHHDFEKNKADYIFSHVGEVANLVRRLTE